MEVIKKVFSTDQTTELVSFLSENGSIFGTDDLVKQFDITKESLESTYTDLLATFKDKSVSCLITFDKCLCQIRKLPSPDDPNLFSLEVTLSDNLTDFISIPKLDLMESKEPLTLDLFTKNDVDILEKYLTNVSGNVYAFKNLPEEVVAVLLSYVSRSPNTFKENLLKLLKEDELSMGSSSTPDMFTKSSEKASKFHEKWVLRYSHDSCAELSQIKFGIDQISILATKELEDNRLGSYIEKSTRYQQFDSNSYHLPDLPHGLDIAYCDMMDYLFNAYNNLFPPTIEALKALYPNTANVSEKAYLNSIQAKACDILRYLLPTSTYTSMGFSVNARTAANMISKLKTNLLSEVNYLSDEIKKEALKICPTLVKYATFNSFRDSLITLGNKEGNSTVAPFTTDKKPNLSLSTPVAYQSLLNELYVSLIYPYSSCSYLDLMSEAKDLTMSYKSSFIIEAMEKREKFDSVPRCFEHIPVAFDLVCDYGAFRDLQRHRKVSWQKQILTPDLGYQAHPDLELLPEDLQQIYHNAFYFNKLFYGNLIEGGVSELVAQYSLCMGWNVRSFLSMDLREAITIVELRSKEAGHISYRLVAQSMYALLIDKFPVLKNFVNCDMSKGKKLERLTQELKYNK